MVVVANKVPDGPPPNHHGSQLPGATERAKRRTASPNSSNLLPQMCQKLVATFVVQNQRCQPVPTLLQREAGSVGPAYFASVALLEQAMTGRRRS